MELIVQKREVFGKKVSALRKNGFIPAELYGHGFKNLHLNVPAKEFLRLFKEAGESTVVKLKIKSLNSEAGEEFNILIHDIQKNSLTGEISHIDFYAVKMDEKITAAVPLDFVGEAPAVKEKGGILVKAIHEIEVETLPADLPRHLEVDLTSLSEIGASLRIKDLKVKQGVKILVDPETVIATVTELVEEVEAAPTTVEEVKVEGQEKKAKTEEGEEKKETPQ